MFINNSAIIGRMIWEKVVATKKKKRKYENSVPNYKMDGRQLVKIKPVKDKHGSIILTMSEEQMKTDRTCLLYINQGSN